MEIHIGPDELDDVRDEQGAVQLVPPALQRRKPGDGAVLMEVKVEPLERPELVVSRDPGFINDEGVGQIRAEARGREDPTRRELLARLHLHGDVQPDAGLRRELPHPARGSEAKHDQQHRGKSGGQFFRGGSVFCAERSTFDRPSIPASAFTPIEEK